MQKRILTTSFSHRCVDGHRFWLHVLTHYEYVLTRLFTARHPQVVRQNAPADSRYWYMAALFRWRLRIASILRQDKRVWPLAGHRSHNRNHRPAVLCLLLRRRFLDGERKTAGLVPEYCGILHAPVGPVHNFCSPTEVRVLHISHRSHHRRRSH